MQKKEECDLVDVEDKPEDDVNAADDEASGKEKRPRREVEVDEYMRNL